MSKTVREKKQPLTWGLAKAGLDIETSAATRYCALVRADELQTSFFN